MCVSLRSVPINYSLGPAPLVIIAGPLKLSLTAVSRIFDISVSEKDKSSFSLPADYSLIN